MNTRIPALASLTVLALTAGQANEAQLTIACQSMAMYPASADDAIGATYESSYTADFSEEGEILSVNHEWFPFSGTVGYASVMEMTDTLFEIPYVAWMEADIPLSGDTNLNFITDFFEVDRAVEAQTSGSVDFGGGAEPVVAFWTREAGNTLGRLRLAFASPSPVGDELVFEHTFEIFQYRGTLTYQPANAVGGEVAATVNLVRQGAEGGLQGPLPMVVTDARSLERKPTRWTAVDQTEFDLLGTFEVEGVELFLDRVASRPWYVGSFFFLDGVPGTPFQDEYDLWDAFVNDPNDGDGDGIPDLTDPASTVVTEPPVLTMAAESNSLRFVISGKPGTTVNLERRDVLGAGSWSLLQSVSLVNATETVVVDRPGADTFYRASIP